MVALAVIAVIGAAAALLLTRSTPSSAVASGPPASVASASVAPVSSGGPSSRPPSSVAPSSVASASVAPSSVAGSEVLVGAGDIANCKLDTDEATARLLDSVEGTVFTAGDNAYPDGSDEDFTNCYDPTWGRHKDRTRFPVAGNHDWETDGAAGYLDYFGKAASPAGTTWYAAALGAWRVIVLDSNCDSVGGCDDGSPQVEWLRKELETNAAECTVALWHHPRFSSGDHGDDDRTDAFWRVLDEAGAELILNGHDHDYQRFGLQDPDRHPDPDGGIRQFVVGTGGTALRRFQDDVPNTEARSDETHGVLRVELAAGGYSWTFMPIAGETFTDAGSGTCH